MEDLSFQWQDLTGSLLYFTIAIATHSSTIYFWSIVSKAVWHISLGLYISSILVAYFHKIWLVRFWSIITQLLDGNLNQVASERNQSKLNLCLSLSNFFSTGYLESNDCFSLSLLPGTAVWMRENAWVNSFISTPLFQLIEQVIVIFYQPHFLFKSGMKIFFAI